MRNALALVLTFGLLSPGLADTRMGEAAEVSGETLLVRPDATGDLEPGDALHQGDRVLTGPDALALLLLTPETRVHLGPDSALTLTADLAAAGGTLVLGGALVFERPEGAAALPVTLVTAFGEIGVRGTRFFVGPSRGAYAVFVDRGRVEVTSAGASVSLGAGEGTELVQGAPPGAPVAWAAERIAEAFASAGQGR